MRAQVPQGEGVHGGVGVMWSRTVKSLERRALRRAFPTLRLACFRASAASTAWRRAGGVDGSAKFRLLLLCNTEYSIQCCNMNNAAFSIIRRISKAAC